MILKQKFKTLAGAQKCCAFENAHRHVLYGNENMVYSIVWFVDGNRCTFPDTISREVLEAKDRVHWQIEKKRKQA
jgi:hypothetical protein